MKIKIARGNLLKKPSEPAIELNDGGKKTYARRVVMRGTVYIIQQGDSVWIETGHGTNIQVVT